MRSRLLRRAPPRSPRLVGIALAVAAVVPVVLASCVGDEPPADLRPRLLESWGRNGAMARYARVAEVGGKLAEEIRTICTVAGPRGEGGDSAVGGGGQFGGESGSQSPRSPDLARARALYGEARRAWLLSRPFAFGPEMEQPARLGANIDFQPPRHEAVLDLLQSSEPLPQPELTGAHLRGFSALEFVLFGAPAQDLISGDERTCDYGVGIADDLRESAGKLLLAWDPEGGDFLGSVSQPAPGRMPFESLHDALSEVVNRMAFTVENIRRDEVMLALGEDADSAVPEQVRSRLSGRSVLDIGDQIDGLADLYFGFGGDPGLSDYASARGYDFDRDVRRALDAVRMALDALEPSLEVAITSERAVVEQLQMSLRDLQILIQVDIVGALGLTQNFNDNDGD